MFLVCAIDTVTAQQETVTKEIGGTVHKTINGQQIPVAGATVILKLETNNAHNPNTVEYRTFVTNASGYYGPTSKTFYCGNASFAVEATGLLDNGQTQRGVGGSGGWSCSHAEQLDWTNYWHTLCATFF